jgi:RNA polymerase sigma-70 factor, ECF subfamily
MAGTAGDRLRKMGPGAWAESRCCLGVMETNLECNRPVGTTSGNPAWTEIVERVRSGDPSGMEELYQIFSKGLRYFLFRRIGPQDLEDRIHDIFLIVIQAIQRGDLRDPERLPGYIRTIAQRQVAVYIDDVTRARRNRDTDTDVRLSDRQPNPEWKVIDRENVEVAMRILRSLRSRDREVLVRFYLKEEPMAQICSELELSETQFRLIKSRAKARFGELGKACLASRKGPHSSRAMAPQGLVCVA